MSDSHEQQNDTVNSGDLDKLLNAGRKFHQSGNLDKAMQCYQHALNLQPGNPEIYNLMGVVALNTGQNEVAKELFLTAITLNENQALYHRNLATSQLRLAENKDAEKACRRSISLDDSDSIAYTNLGAALFELQHYSEAVAPLETAIMLNKLNASAMTLLAKVKNKLQCYSEAEPVALAASNLAANNAEAMAELAIALRYNGKPVEAINVGEQLIKLEPGIAEHYVSLAKTYIELGKSAEAEKAARNAIKLEPDNAMAYSVLAAAVVESLGWDEARKNIDRAIALDSTEEQFIIQKASILELMGETRKSFELIKPLVHNRKFVNTPALMTYATLAEKFGHEKNAAKILESVLNNSGLPDLVRLTLSFSAGKLFDRQKKYDKAFGYFAKANSLKPREYKRETAERLYKNIKENFNADFLESAPCSSASGEGMIFIVGMPRSGTSLTEQILASHPQVKAAGELKQIDNVCTTLPAVAGYAEAYPIYAANLTPDVLNDAAKMYMDYINTLFPDNTGKITDKMPLNFIYLGMIYLMFPQAKIIHCNRDPIDTCLSCYFLNFSTSGLSFAYNLEDLGHQYQLYMSLMSHWKSTLPVDIYELKYEMLVDSPDSEVPKLLEFCGLEWDDACLQHHKSSLTTVTASYEQVRQPIYKSSVKRWKNYEKHIGKLIQALNA